MSDFKTVCKVNVGTGLQQQKGTNYFWGTGIEISLLSDCKRQHPPQCLSSVCGL